MVFDITTLLNTVRFSTLLKTGVLILLGAFLIFLFVVYKQVHSLNQAVRQTVYGAFLEFLSVLLIFIVVVLFLISVAIL